jgi:hypothetical protein
VRAILAEALAKAPLTGLGSRVHQRFADVGGAELDLPPRDDEPRIPDLSW